MPQPGNKHQPEEPAPPAVLPYRSNPISPYDKPVEDNYWVRLASRRRGRRGLGRTLYWIIMLSLIGGLLWYIRAKLHAAGW